MGAEILCSARYQGQAGEGKAHLDTEEVLFRGPFRLRVPFRSLTRVEAVDGTLMLGWDGAEAELDLGPAAAKWAEKIRNPRTLLDKLGVKPGMRISVVDLEDPEFLAQLQARTEALSIGEPVPGSDLIFLGLEEHADLERLDELKGHLHPDGAIWTIRPKGRREITEADVMSRAKAAGLVDVKVAKFSETHTAEKLVIPLALRPKA